MNRKVLLFLIVFFLLFIGVGFYFYRKSRAPKLPVIKESPSPRGEELEKRFNITFPEGSQRILLNDQKGEGNSGVLIKKEEGDKTSLTILADLPDPDPYFYQVWLVGDDQKIKLGRLQVAKGGFLFEDEIEGGIFWKRIIVSKETKDDSEIEDIFLSADI